MTFVCNEVILQNFIM